MIDRLDARTRSRNMSAVKSKGNLSTEWRLRSRMIQKGINGWELHPRDVIGKPDFVFRREKIAVFVDGCFWHGCRYCRTLPSTNKDFWKLKIASNKNRDKLVRSTLGGLGWTTIAIWEHEIKDDPESCVAAIEFRLRRKRKRTSSSRY